MASLPEDLSATKISFQEAVLIQVGPRDVNFVIHMPLLLSTAGVFRGTNVVNVRDPETQAFRFANRDPNLFDFFVRWLYKQHPKSDSLSDIIGAYFFALELDAPAFRNHLVSMMYNTLIEQHYFPTAEDLTLLWNAPEGDTPLRKLVLDVCVWGATQPAVGWSQVLRELPASFVIDFAIAHASRSGQQAPYANGTGPYIEQVPEDRQHPYRERETRPDTSVSSFADVVKATVSVTQDVFYFHPTLFHGLDPQLDEKLDDPTIQSNGFVLPDTDSKVFGAFIEWAYFHDNDETNPFLLFPAAEPLGLAEIEVASGESSDTFREASTDDGNHPNGGPVQSNLSSWSSDTTQHTSLYSTRAIATTSDGTRPAPAYSRGYAGPPTIDRIGLPLGWGYYTSNFRRRLYTDQITETYTNWDPRALGELPEGWTVRLERSGELWFENPGSGATSDDHPSDAPNRWAGIRIPTISRGRRAFFGAPR